MNFRTIDNLFLQAKKIVTVFIFIFLIISVLFFLYWLIVSMKIVLPDFINVLFMGLINMIAIAIKDSPLYKNVEVLLPLVVSMLFIVLTYLFNCILAYLEDAHKKFGKYVNNYKMNLEVTINKQLQKNYIDELNKTKFFMTMVKIEVKNLNSYLHEPVPEEEIKALENKILSSLCKLMNLPCIMSKVHSDENVLFICNDLRMASEFYANIVQKTVALINKNMMEKISINFFCAVDVFDNENEINFKTAEIKKITDLRIRNKILVSPRFKVFYQEMYPGYFIFKLLGEYNFSKTAYKSQYVNIYTLHRNV